MFIITVIFLSELPKKCITWNCKSCVFHHQIDCDQIPNSSRIVKKQDMYRNHRKKPSCRYENKGSNFHLIWSQISLIKFFWGATIQYSFIFKNQIIRYLDHIHYSVQLCDEGYQKQHSEVDKYQTSLKLSVIILLNYCNLVSILESLVLQQSEIDS